MNVLKSLRQLIFCVVCCFSAVATAAGPTPVLNCTISAPAVPRRISPDIYGMAAPSVATITGWNVPLIRWGGNTAERYNRQLGNAWNTGKDWYFENVAIEGHAWQNFLQNAERTGARVCFNLPLIGFVASDTTSHGFFHRKIRPATAA